MSCEKMLHKSISTFVCCICQCFNMLIFLPRITFKYNVVAFVVGFVLAEPNIFVRIKFCRGINWRGEGVPLVILGNRALIILPEESIWLHSFSLLEMVGYLLFILMGVVLIRNPIRTVAFISLFDNHVWFRLFVAKALVSLRFRGRIINVRLWFMSTQTEFWVGTFWIGLLPSVGTVSWAILSLSEVSLFINFIFMIEPDLSHMSHKARVIRHWLLLTLALLLKNKPGLFQHIYYVQ